MLLGYLEGAFTTLDSAYQGIDRAVMKFKAYFDQFNEIEQEADEIYGKLLEIAHQSPDHEINLRSHHAALLQRTTSLENNILAKVRSYW